MKIEFIGAGANLEPEIPGRLTAVCVSESAPT